VRERLFSATDESVVLIAADDFGHAGTLEVRSVATASDLAAVLAGGVPDEAYRTLGNGRAISVAAAEHLDALVRLPAFTPLGGLLTCHIGVVTGANHHFVLRNQERDDAQLPAEATVPIVSRTAWLNGLVFEEADFESAAASGGRAHLVRSTPELDETPAMQRWIERGREAGLAERHKCAERKPWHRVGVSKPPVAFITAMRLGAPRLVLNQAGCLCTNTIYAADPIAPASTPLEALAVAFLTTPVALWAELHGRRYSRGVLKLDVGTLGKLPLPIVPEAGAGLAEIDVLLRAGNDREARRVADRVVLVDALKVDALDLALLERALDEVRGQRLSILDRG
jgi:hypothetical protein